MLRPFLRISFRGLRGGGARDARLTPFNMRCESDAVVKVTSRGETPGRTRRAANNTYYATYCCQCGSNTRRISPDHFFSVFKFAGLNALHDKFAINSIFLLRSYVAEGRPFTIPLVVFCHGLSLLARDPRIDLETGSEPHQSFASVLSMSRIFFTNRERGASTRDTLSPPAVPQSALESHTVEPSQAKPRKGARRHAAGTVHPQFASPMH
jgi:hypothetical protein